MNGKEQVWDQVEAFRRQYLVGPLAHLPVDVFTLAEIELHLDIIPFDDLYEKYEVDAALIQDNWFTSPDLRHGFAEGARHIFEVNTQVIETRLDREGIWAAS